MRSLSILFFLLVATSSPAAEIISVKKIWDQAPHSAFTDLIRFQDQFFCVFREGNAHVSPDGALRVLTSPDGETWKSSALITHPTNDLRDAKITVTPNNQLMLSGAAAIQSDGKTSGHQSLTWYSDDGHSWSDAHKVADLNTWLWRTTWTPSTQTAYGIGYGTTTNPGVFRLYKSTDGKTFTTHVPDLFPDDPSPNESSILFRKGGTAHCLVRRDRGANTALLGTSSPPYKEWSWADLDIRIGGPHMIELPDGRTVAAVRLYDKPVRTALCWLDPKNATLSEFLTLPSGGDTSYAGLVWHDDHLYVSYYSSHEAKTAIYLAKVTIPEK